LVLYRKKPINWKSVPLPGREESRNLLIVEFKDFIFCCTHFSLNEEDRLKSVTIINDYFKISSKPVFLAGDFNAVPGSAVVKNIETRWHILNNPHDPTIPAENPNRCIDYILVSKNSGRIFKVEHTAVEKEPVALNHLPVWIKVRIDL